MKVVTTWFVMTTVCFLASAREFWFGRENKPHRLDGKLRCYQCDSQEETLQKVSHPVCSMDRWHLSNQSEKRGMVTYCTEKRSAFCVLIVEARRTIRGCYGLAYRDKSQPHYGCFLMAEGGAPDRRVCLCTTNLCNRAAPPPLLAAPHHALSFALILHALNKFTFN